MTEQEVREWLDKANKQLLAEIEQSIPVRFSFWTKDYFGCQFHKNEDGVQCEVEVYYEEPLSQAKIAHELLHAKTSIVLGDNAIMFAIENQTIPFKYLMKKENASQIVNACEHVIFFPDFLDMGYLEDDSFEPPKDLAKSFATIDELSTQKLKENGNYSIKKVFEYIALSFSFLFYPNEKRFKKQVKTLKQIDYPLFSIMSNLRRACTDCAIEPENKDFIQESYFDFANDLNKWFDKAFNGAVIF